MRFILIVLLATGMVMAMSKDTCYSVQLESFVIEKDSNYNFEEQKYPDSCQLISFASMNAIRCGCFEKYNDAKQQQKIFEAKYHHSMIVNTYSYRFAAKKSIVHVKPKEPTISVVMQEEQESEESIPLPVPEVEKVSNFLQDIVIQGNVNLTTQTYITKPSSKHASNFTASGTLDLAYNKENFKAFVKIKAQEDYYDIKGGEDSTDRSYLRLNELYSQYDFGDSQIMFGKNIRFWGALEVYNITDNFNISEFRSDPVEKDKLGSWNVAYTKYTDNGEISLIAKFYEQDRKMSAFPYLYYPFTSNLITYDSNLKTEKSSNRPSVYLKYSGSTDNEYTIDYSVIFENGYDSQRYYTEPTLPDTTIYENAYLVNKIMTYNTLVLSSTLYKLEAVYADVIDNDEVSDYFSLGLGIEHTLTQIHEEADLGLLAEYYRYEVIDKSKRNDLELFEIYQNDLFIGLRYSFNEGNDASIVGGAILDLDYNEQVYYMKYESRIADIFKLSLDYRQVEAANNVQTAFNRMGKQKRIGLKLGYFF